MPPNILGISIRTLRNKLNEYADGGLPITPAGAGDYHRVARRRNSCRLPRITRREASLRRNRFRASPVFNQAPAASLIESRRCPSCKLDPPIRSFTPKGEAYAHC